MAEPEIEVRTDTERLDELLAAIALYLQKHGDRSAEFELMRGQMIDMRKMNNATLEQMAHGIRRLENTFAVIIDVLRDKGVMSNEELQAKSNELHARAQAQAQAQQAGQAQEEVDHGFRTADGKPLEG